MWREQSFVPWGVLFSQGNGPNLAKLILIEITRFPFLA